MPKLGDSGTAPDRTPGQGVKSSPQDHGLYWSTQDGDYARLYYGDVRDNLRLLPDGCVQSVITSPPYWNLRDYQTSQWVGGDPALAPGCDHKRPSQRGRPHKDRRGQDGNNNTNWDHRHETGYKNTCGKCGAHRISKELGQEQIMDCLGWAQYTKRNCALENWETGCYVCRMRVVFAEVHRVLRDDGTLWLNLGDVYHGSGPLEGNTAGMPWALAFALRADGWILRMEHIWAKPAPTPDSAPDRCTKAHEQVFLLVKQRSYFCDMHAIRQRGGENYSGGGAVFGKKRHKGVAAKHKAQVREYDRPDYREVGAKKRDVWEVDDHSALLRWLQGRDPALLAQFLEESNQLGSYWWVSSQQGYPGAHFATFPTQLIEPMVLAGTSEKGACARCGAPWRRLVDKVKEPRGDNFGKRDPDQTFDHGQQGSAYLEVVGETTIGWEPTCSCHGTFVKVQRTKTVLRPKVKGVDPYDRDHSIPKNRNGKDSVTMNNGKLEVEEREIVVNEWEYRPHIPLDDHPVVPCVILDPFVGSGTTSVVATDHKRRSIGIDLSEEYLAQHAMPRVVKAIQRMPSMHYLLQEENDE